MDRAGRGTLEEETESYHCYALTAAGTGALRTDHANHFLGLRLNDWTSIVLFAGAVFWLYWRRNVHREEHVEPEPQPTGEQVGSTA